MKIRDAFTFDDVLLEPARSAVLPGETDIQTRLTRKIRLNVPLMSAAMDTSDRTSACHHHGYSRAIGVVHKNFTIEDQAMEISRSRNLKRG